MTVTEGRAAADFAGFLRGFCRFISAVWIHLWVKCFMVSLLWDVFSHVFFYLWFRQIRHPLTRQSLQELKITNSERRWNTASGSSTFEIISRMPSECLQAGVAPLKPNDFADLSRLLACLRLVVFLECVSKTLRPMEPVSQQRSCQRWMLAVCAIASDFVRRNKRVTDKKERSLNALHKGERNDCVISFVFRTCVIRLRNVSSPRE